MRCWLSLLPLVAMAALGLVWWHDRGRAWETPRWDERWFPVLRAGAEHARARATERWVVAVNPECSHCLIRLAALDDSLDALRTPELVALVVDTPSRPGPQALAAIRAPRVHWDETNRWRVRWGHRAYGEVLRFDEAGRYLSGVPSRGRGARQTKREGR